MKKTALLWSGFYWHTVHTFLRFMEREPAFRYSECEARENPAFFGTYFMELLVFEQVLLDG
ncbi:hypothetical protein B9K06_04520 [Bacillus sp. OG2]|nr:hypothetical protein B9K06_04520 [Bacillus sp. OG2]